MKLHKPTNGFLRHRIQIQSHHFELYLCTMLCCRCRSIHPRTQQHQEKRNDNKTKSCGWFTARATLPFVAGIKSENKKFVLTVDCQRLASARLLTQQSEKVMMDEWMENDPITVFIYIIFLLLPHPRPIFLFSLCHWRCRHCSCFVSLSVNCVRFPLYFIFSRFFLSPPTVPT